MERKRVMPVERAETPVEQRQNVAEGGDGAPGIEVVRSEIQGLYEQPVRVCSECETTHSNTGGLTGRQGKDWVTFAFCPACKCKRWTKPYRWNGGAK